MDSDAPSSVFNRIEKLTEEYLGRIRRGEHPTPAEYAARYPQHAARILELFATLEMLEGLKLTPDVQSGPRDHAGDESLDRGRGAQRLGDYTLLRELGRGGMGIVSEAEHESLKNRVALKVMHPRFRTDRAYVRRFETEARSAAKLHHTNIVPVFDYGEQDGVCYYAMQYIAGVGLERVLEDVRRLRDPAASAAPAADTPDATGATAATTDSLSVVTRGLLTGRFAFVPTASAAGATATLTMSTGPPAPGTIASAAAAREPGPPPSAYDGSSGSGSLAGQSESVYFREVARLGAQVADALDYAHRQGVVHRDIKPSNLLLDALGNVWVTDFGLAKLVQGDDASHSHDLVGTLRFMAPERLRGVTDPRGDIYALGATLYELLTLQPAFADQDQARLLDQIAHQPPLPVRRHDRRIPRDLETLVLKALAKDPVDRFASAGELRDELRRFLESRPIKSRPVGVVERLWRWGKRNPLVASAAGMVAAALVAMTVTAVLYADRQYQFAIEQEKANTEITRLNTNLGKQSERLTASLAGSNRLLAIRNFDRGQAAFEKDQIGPGLLWMIESWRSAVEAGDPAWQHAARANLGAWQPHHARLKAVFSHESPASAAAISPNGKIVVTGSDDRTARLWETATGKPVGQPLHHPGSVYGLAFSPDGKIILSGCSDGNARLWDVVTGRSIGSPLTHRAEVMAVAFSPDGRMILTGSEDKTARLWDASSHRPIGEPFVHRNTVESVTFSPNGRSFASASGDRSVRQWDIAARTSVALPIQERQPMYAVAFSPDGKTVLTGGSDRMARFWETSTGKPLGQPIPHRLKVRYVAFSPDGRTILTGCEDKMARLWDAVTNQLIGLPLVHQGPVVVVAFSHDGRSFLTASSDNTVRLWDADPGQPFGLLREYEDVGHAVAYGPDGKSILTGHEDGTARHWDATTAEIIGETIHHQGPVMAVAISPDGSTLLTGSYDKTARLWDSITGKSIGPSLQHEDRVSVVAFSPDGKTILTGGEDRKVRIWDASTGMPLGQPILHSGAVDAGAFSPDSMSFVAGCDSGSAQVWDLATRTPKGQPFPHPGCISAAAFSPDGKTLLTGCEDGAARLWDVITHKLRTAPLNHRSWIWGVAFSPDGKTVLTGSRDGSARLWDSATGMPLGPPIPHTAQVYSVAFSPDGNSFLTGDYSHAARLFRKIPELPDDLERVAAWAEVLTGLTLDAGQGTIRVLDNGSWRKRREQLKQRGGPPEAVAGPKLDPVLFGPDPKGRGRGLMERGKWDEAEAAFDELVRARPYNASTWIERSRFHITRGQPEQAVANFTLAIRRQPDNLQLRHCQALSLLSQGDQAGLRQACSDLLGRCDKLTDPQTSNSVAWSCLLGPDSVADREAPLRLAEGALAGLPAGEKPTAMSTLGAALYRAGRFEKSINCLEECIQKRNGESLPQDWVFLALAHHRLGHRAEALRWLARFQTYEVNAKPDSFWDELEIRLLRCQAEAVIRYDPSFPSDPFAH